MKEQPKTDRAPEGDETMRLLKAAQGGEKEALEVLFARYYDRVAAVVRLRLGRELRREGETLDVLHESLIQAMASIERFEPRHEARLIDWFAGIVEHRLCALARYGRAAKRDRRLEVAMEDVREHLAAGRLAEMGTGVEMPEEEVARREERVLLDEALLELRPNQARVLRLRMEEELSWARIADAMELATPDAARMLFTRAREELTKRMERLR